MRHTVLQFLICGLISFGTPNYVHAADATAPPVEQRSAAQKLFEAGDTLYEAGKFADAVQAFRQSHALVQSPNSQLMLARSLRELGNTTEACEVFRATVAAAANSGGRYPEAQKAAVAELAALESQKTQQNPTVASPAPEEEPRPSTATDNVPKAPEQKTTAQLAAPNRFTRTAAWTSAGVATAGGLGFVVFGYLNRKTYQDLQDACPAARCTENPSDRVSAGKTYQLLSNISLGVLAVGAAAATTFFVLSPAKAKPTVGLSVAPGAVLINGRF